MKILRQAAAATLCFCGFIPSLPQVNALGTRSGEAQAIQSNLQQRIALAQQEMQANAMALALHEMGPDIQNSLLDLVKQAVGDFMKELVYDFKPVFNTTCDRVVHRAAGFAPPEAEAEDSVSPAEGAFAQLQETLFAKDACEAKTAVSFKPKGRMTGSFLEDSGFWETLKQGGSVLKTMATPFLGKIKENLLKSLRKIFLSKFAPKLKADVSLALNNACEQAIERVEEEEQGSAYPGYEDYPEEPTE